MSEAICAFTGHRSSKLPWKYDEEDPRCIRLKQYLLDVILSLCETGLTSFVCGMALGCDTYFAEAVLRAREQYPSVTLEAAVPYRGQADEWSREQRQRYRDILGCCDRVTVLREEYSPSCMMARNRYMVDRCSILIVCYDDEKGGTQNTLRYAREKRKELILLPIEE